MAGSKEIEAGRAVLRLLIDDKEFHKSLDSASRKVDDFGRGLQKTGIIVSAMGAAITGPLVAALHTFASFGSEIGHLSEKTGIGAQGLTTLAFAANRSGVELGSVETAIKKMQKALVAGSEGSAEAESAFNKLGYTAQQLRQKSPEAQFYAVAKALNGVADPAEKAALALKIFGKSGTDLIPLIDGLEEAKTRAADLGIVMGGDATAKAIQLEKAFKDLGFAVKYLVSQIGGELAPAVTKYTVALTNALPTLVEFVKQHADGILRTAEFGAALLVLGPALGALGTGFRVAALGATILMAALRGMAADPITAGIIGLGIAFTALYGFIKQNQEAAEELEKTLSKMDTHAPEGAIRPTEFGPVSESEKTGGAASQNVPAYEKPTVAIGPPVIQPVPLKVGEVGEATFFGGMGGAPPQLQPPGTPARLFPKPPEPIVQPTIGVPPALLIPRLTPVAGQPGMQKLENDAVLRNVKSETLNRGTFTGSIAGQVLGGGGSIDKQQLDTQKKMERHLAIIAQKQWDQKHGITAGQG